MAAAYRDLEPRRAVRRAHAARDLVLALQRTRVFRRGLQDAARRRHPGRAGRLAVPAELALGPHPAGGRPGCGRRHVCRHGDDGFQPQ